MRQNMMCTRDARRRPDAIAVARAAVSGPVLITGMLVSGLVAALASLILSGLL